MRAAVLEAVDGPFLLEDVEPVALAPAAVRVRMAGAAFCITDCLVQHGALPSRLPTILGHSAIGVVEEAGPDVRRVQVGQRVVVPAMPECRECYFCQRGRGNMCERWQAIGVTATGGAAEYVAAPVANCVVLPGSIRPVDAALVEPLSCAVHGFDVLAPTMGDHYLIYGAGTMGLMMMELAKRAGAASVSMDDLNPARLQTARELGCSAAVASADELDRPRGWDNVIDCTGVVAAIEDGLPRVIKGGTFQQFGVANEDAVARFSPFTVYNQEIRIIGSMAVLRSYERAAQLFAEGVLRADVMISDRKPLDDYPAALEQFRAGVGRKIQVNP